MAGNTARRLGVNGVDGIDSAGGTGRHNFILKIWRNVRGGGNGIGSFVVLERPLLLGALDLAKVIDAGIRLCLRRSVRRQPIARCKCGLLLSSQCLGCLGGCAQRRSLGLCILRLRLRILRLGLRAGWLQGVRAASLA